MIHRVIPWLAFLSIIVASCGFFTTNVEVIPGKLSVDLPGGLHLGSDADIKGRIGYRYKSNLPDERVYVDGTYNFYVIINVGAPGQAVTPSNQVTAMAQQIDSHNANFAGHKSKIVKQESRTIAGSQWAYMEVIFEDSEQGVLLFGVVDKRPVSIAYDAAVFAKDPGIQKSIAASIETIK